MTTGPRGSEEEEEEQSICSIFLSSNRKERVKARISHLSLFQLLASQCCSRAALPTSPELSSRSSQ